MANKYQVNFQRYDSGTVTVVAEDEDEAVEKAYDHLPSLCAQCSGWGRKASVDDSEWDLIKDKKYKINETEYEEKAVELLEEGVSEEDDE